MLFETFSLFNFFQPKKPFVNGIKLAWDPFMTNMLQSKEELTLVICINCTIMSCLRSYKVLNKVFTFLMVLFLPLVKPMMLFCIPIICTCCTLYNLLLLALDYCQKYSVQLSDTKTKLMLITEKVEHEVILLNHIRVGPTLLAKGSIQIKKCHKK